MRISGESRKGERGSILAASAIGMLAMILAVGLCIDIGHFYVVKTELQNAADAAALAGVSALNSQASGINTAVSRATAAMNKADFNKAGVSIPSENVTFAINLGGPYMSASSAAAAPQNIRFIRVSTAPQNVSVAFARIVLGGSKGLAATATAGLSVPTNVFCDWIPLAVLDNDIATLLPGNTYTIRAGPQGSVSPGNYQVLAAMGAGGSDVRIGLAQGVKQCISPGQTVPTKPGVNAGDVRQGINTRFDVYSGTFGDPTLQPPDTNIKENITYKQYGDPTGPKQAPTHPGSPERRVVLVPIVKISEFDQGRDTIKIDRFAAFFLQTKVDGGNGGDIQAEYIGVNYVDASAGYDPQGGAGNPLIVKPVLYQ
jgi:Flp pilus assembly protein TadG